MAAVTAPPASDRRILYDDDIQPGDPALVYISLHNEVYFKRVRGALLRLTVHLAKVMDELHRHGEQRKASPLIIGLAAVKATLDHYKVPFLFRPVYRVTEKIKAPSGTEADQAILDEKLGQTGDICVRHMIVLTPPPPLYSSIEEAPPGDHLRGIRDPRPTWINLENQVVQATGTAGDGAIADDAHLSSWLVSDVMTMEQRARSIILGTPITIQQEDTLEPILYTPRYSDTRIGLYIKTSQQATDAEIFATVSDFDAHASDSWREVRDKIVKVALKEQDAKADKLIQRMGSQIEREKKDLAIRQREAWLRAKHKAIRARRAGGDSRAAAPLRMLEDLHIASAAAAVRRGEEGTQGSSGGAAAATGEEVSDMD